MFHEYAVDPEVLSTWERARYFLDALGPWKGRFLAEFPRRWKKMVFTSLRCPDMEKHRIIERLNQLDPKVFSGRKGAAYDGALSWLDNARAEHGRQPFRAIVSTGVSQPDMELLPVDVDECNPLWCAQHGRLIPREPKAFAEALRVLVAASRRVVVVDPYFRADQADKAAVLAAFCQLANGRTDVTFDVHASNVQLSYLEQQRHARRALPRILPDGLSVTVHCWNERAGGERLHNRYVLTEVGGAQFGDSLERGATGQHDRLSILSESDRAHLWDQFYGPSAAFDLVGAPEIVRGTARAL
jgi:hypothetical protein